MSEIVLNDVEFDNIKNIIFGEVSKSFSDIEIVEINYKTMYKQLNFNVYIWKKSGIEFTDCENVHNLVSEILDKYENIFPDSYVLNVCSSGLDRKIISNDDYRRSLDTDVEVVDETNKKFHGLLKEYNDNSFTIIVKNNKGTKELSFDRNKIKKLQPFIKF